MKLGEIIVKQITNLNHVRVRDIDGCAKIEVDKQQISVFTNEKLIQIQEKLQMIGFKEIKIDPEGYMPGKINVIAD